MSDDFTFLPQTPFGPDDFASNPQPRCPVVLLLDNSGSMAGTPIAELNQGLALLKQELAADELAAIRCEIAIVTFGPVEVVQDFVSATSFIPPMLRAAADTPMGAAVERGLDMVKNRKAVYKENGISYYRPWLFLITDGAPTDSWSNAARRVKESEEANEIAFFAIGVKGADMTKLAQLSVRSPMPLDGMRFRELFQWLSASLKAVSQSQPGQRLALPPARGWNEV